MGMEMTPRWALPLLLAGQAQKELFHNEALVRIDALLCGVVQSADRASPPAEPAIGQCWIVATGPDGAWADHAGDVACWTEGGWRFIAPANGMSMTIADQGHELCHDGVQWRDAPVRRDGLYVQDRQMVGPRHGAISPPAGGGTIDVEARNTINAMLAAMRGHGLIDT